MNSLPFSAGRCLNPPLPQISYANVCVCMKKLSETFVSTREGVRETYKLHVVSCFQIKLCRKECSVNHFYFLRLCSYDSEVKSPRCSSLQMNGQRQRLDFWMDPWIRWNSRTNICVWQVRALWSKEFSCTVHTPTRFPYLDSSSQDARTIRDTGLVVYIQT